MHLMRALAVLLILTGLVFLVVSTSAAYYRLRWAAAGSVSIIIAVSFISLLVYAQRPVCTALSGRWIPTTEACRHEFGGNGSNNP